MKVVGGPEGTTSPGRKGALVRVRAQALGVLALSISIAVVIVVVFVVPRGTPAAVVGHARSGPDGQTSDTHPTVGGPGPLSTASPPTTAPAAGTSGSSTPEGVGSPSGDGRPTGNASSSASAPAASPSGGTVAPTAITTAPSTTSPTGPGTTATATASTTVATSTTTTSPSPAYTPSHVATDNWPGNLQDPYVSAQYEVTTVGGMVSGTATWSGTPTLVLTVTCGGASKELSGASGLYVSVDAPAGSCTIALAEPAGIDAAVSYSLSADYPAS